jgi:hypothetical protein
MAAAFDFISHTDKPALLALSTPEWLAKVKAQLTALGYKVHAAANHEDFFARFGQVQYQVVVVEELFAATTPTENLTLPWLQALPMSHRRHTVILLLGPSFDSLNTMQAYQQSVHGVIHPSELESVGQIVQKVVAENDLFLQNFRQVQLRVARGEQ